MSAPPGSEVTPTLTVTHLYEAHPTLGTEGAPLTDPSTAYTRKFLEGEPKALGVTKVLIGLVQILFGIPLTISLNLQSVNLASPFLIGIVFIVSGALSIAAEQKPQIKLLQSCLVMNIISSVLSVFGAIVYIIDMSNIGHCVHNLPQCHRNPNYYVLTFYTLTVLLLFTLLEFTLSLVVSVFVCKSVHCCHPYMSMPDPLLESNILDNQ